MYSNIEGGGTGLKHPQPAGKMRQAMAVPVWYRHMKTSEINEASQLGSQGLQRPFTSAPCTPGPSSVSSALRLLGLRRKGTVLGSMAGARDVGSCLLRCWPGLRKYYLTLCPEDPVPGCPSLARQWTWQQPRSQEQCICWWSDKLSRVRVGEGENGPPVLDQAGEFHGCVEGVRMMVKREKGGQ